MKTYQASFEDNQNSIHNLKIQVGKLAEEIVEMRSMPIRETNPTEVKTHEESLEEKHDSTEHGKEKRLIDFFDYFIQIYFDYFIIIFSRYFDYFIIILLFLV